MSPERGIHMRHYANKKPKNRFDFRLLAAFFVIYLIILIPTFVKIWNIKEIYYDKEVRSAVVDGMFHIRDQTGYALADMRIFNIDHPQDDRNTLLMRYKYHYMGNIDRDKYDDVDNNIVLEYNITTKEKKIISVTKK